MHRRTIDAMKGSQVRCQSRTTPSILTDVEDQISEPAMLMLRFLISFRDGFVPTTMKSIMFRLIGIHFEAVGLEQANI